MFEIAQPAKGRLWMMPCPDGTQLAQDIAAYRNAGAGRIVSMLAVDEAAELGLALEDEVCAQAGLMFDQHPIADFGLPDGSPFYVLVMRIKDQIEDGEGVAVHCRAGIGRSGMVTSGVLIALGLTAADAIAQVSLARGVSVPDTIEQGRFVARFADNLGLKNII